MVFRHTSKMGSKASSQSAGLALQVGTFAGLAKIQESKRSSFLLVGEERVMKVRVVEAKLTRDYG